MAVTMLQYPGSTVAPEDDANLYNALGHSINGRLGTITGSIQNGNIKLTDGYLVIQGRVLKLSNISITPTLPASGTATGKIYVDIDLENTELPADIKTTVGSFSPVTEDINNGGALYQLQIGTYSATTSGISNLDLTLPADITEAIVFENGRIKSNGSYLVIETSGTNYTQIQGGGTTQPGIIFTAGKAISGRIAVGQVIARVSYDDDGGRIIVLNKDGQERIRLGIKSTGAGKIEILDASGNVHTYS